MLINTDEYISLAAKNQEESCWHIPEDIGKGAIHKVRIRAGLELCFSRCVLTRELKFQYKKQIPLLLFNYNLAGRYRVQFGDQDSATEYEGEHLGEYVHGDYDSTWQLIPSVLNQFVSISLYEEFITHCKSNALELPGIITKFQEGCESSSASRISEISSNSREIINEILECPFTGMTRKFFMESKFLCLIVDHLESQDQKGA